MTTARKAHRRGNVIALQVTQSAESSGLSVPSSIVGKHIERSDPEKFGQPDDVGVILR